MFLAVTVGTAAVGALLGAVARSTAATVQGSQLSGLTSRSDAGEPGAAFLSLIVYLLAQAVSAYAIVAALRARSEEASGRADPLLAGPVDRLRWAGSHLIFAALGPAVVLAALGLAAGLTFGLNAGDVSGELPVVLATTVAKLPAVWVMAGLAAALFGLLPRLAAAVSWTVLAGVLVLELAWELGQVSPTLFRLSPFAHVHPLAADPTAASLVGLTAAAAVLAGAGAVGLRRRDLG